MSIPWSAPEVVEEQSSGTISSEVWSLGATVYSLLAGHSPFERRERGQNSKDQLRRRIARASYTEIVRTDVPAELQQVLQRAMSRDPRKRYPTALAFAEALREVQRDLGLALTPLEVAQGEWEPGVAAVDLTDATLRGSVRSHVVHDSRRKKREQSGVRGLARDEDSDISAPTRGGARVPWVLAGVAAAAVAALVVMVVLVVVGVI